MVEEGKVSLLFSGSNSFCFYHLSLLGVEVRFSCPLPSSLQLLIHIRKCSRSEYGIVPGHHEGGTLFVLLPRPNLSDEHMIKNYRVIAESNCPRYSNLSLLSSLGL